MSDPTTTAWHGLSFSVDVSTEYHELRRRFLSRWCLRGHARVHTLLRQLFLALQQDMQTAPVTPESLRQFTARKTGLDALEPPTRYLVALMARNDVCYARGYATAECCAPLRWWHRLWAQWADWGKEGACRCYEQREQAKRDT